MSDEHTHSTGLVPAKPNPFTTKLYIDAHSNEVLGNLDIRPQVSEHIRSLLLGADQNVAKAIQYPGTIAEALYDARSRLGRENYIQPKAVDPLLAPYMSANGFFFRASIDQRRAPDFIYRVEANSLYFTIGVELDSPAGHLRMHIGTRQGEVDFSNVTMTARDKATYGNRDYINSSELTTYYDPTSSDEPDLPLQLMYKDGVNDRTMNYTEPDLKGNVRLQQIRIWGGIVQLKNGEYHWQIIPYYSFTKPPQPTVIDGQLRLAHEKSSDVTVPLVTNIFEEIDGRIQKYYPKAS